MMQKIGQIGFVIVAALALACSAGQAFAQGDSYVTLCYRTRTIQVPFYLRARYVLNGAMVGPCAASNP